MDPHFTLEVEAVRVADIADKSAALRFLAQVCGETYGLDADQVEQALLEREALGSTGFGNGVALPHARLAGIQKPLAALVRIERPIDFEAADGLPVELACALLSPENAGATHLHALAALSRMMRDEQLRARLSAATDVEAIYGIVTNGQDRDAA
ncbi:PTS sugar transporter subunit IIA [Pseudoblastomonas halimionae]|uniref:PTS transporter subunit EIIA n=1 Tax=Alteriqipengyuania halimionae TaxID=1926630 RepID=A0A6I4U7N4_9SPHN|nr:PTS sugar transporter subunit IIA [Alteriqipengyuania halimionae]MXP10835.1 PTS transporter subunit EIIA [Alteriqipengyuania halimionae]